MQNSTFFIIKRAKRCLFPLQNWGKSSNFAPTNDIIQTFKALKHYESTRNRLLNRCNIVYICSTKFNPSELLIFKYYIGCSTFGAS